MSCKKRIEEFLPPIPDAQVLGFGNLSIEVTGSIAPDIDEEYQYTLTVTNNPTPAPAIVEIDIPADATFVSASDSWTYDSGTRKVTRPSANVNSWSNLARTVNITFQNDQEYILDANVSTTSIQPIDADNEWTLSVTPNPVSSWVELRFSTAESFVPTSVSVLTVWWANKLPDLQQDIIDLWGWVWKLGTLDASDWSLDIRIETLTSWVSYRTTWFSFVNADPTLITWAVSYWCRDDEALNYQPTVNQNDQSVCIY